MITKQIKFREVTVGEQFIASYGEHDQLSAVFIKTDWNKGRTVRKDPWDMIFLLDETVDVSG